MAKKQYTLEDLSAAVRRAQRQGYEDAQREIQTALGIPSRTDIEEMMSQIRELQADVNTLQSQIQELELRQ